MDWSIALLSAVVGYLAGSLSFARIVTAIVAPGEQVTDIDFGEDSTRRPVQAISGTAVSMKLGPKYGGITAILDILKAAIPALVFRLVYPGTPYFLISAGASLLGHNWPIYHRFKGGMGISPIYGGFFVLDFLGTLVTALVAMIIGFATRLIFFTIVGGLVLMIPWVWFRTRNLAYLGYLLFVNVIFFIKLMPEIRETVQRRRSGEAGDYSQAMEATPMTKMIKRFGIRLGILPDDEVEEPAPTQ